MLHLMSVPAGLEAAVRLGSAYVDGAMVKDVVSHQILAHLQPTQLLSNLLMNSSPIGWAMDGLELVSSVVQNVQLLKVQQMLETLQVVSSIGAAASVLNLGVSVGGFAMVLSAVRRVDGKMDRALDSLGAMQEMDRSMHRSDIRSILEAAEASFRMRPEEQRSRWNDTEKQAHFYANRTLDRLELLGVPLKGEATRTPSSASSMALPLLQQPGSEAGALLAMLMHLSGVRSEALLCLQCPDQAAEVSRQQVSWLGHLPVDAEATTRTLIGRDLPPRNQLEKLVKQSVGLTTWVSRSRAVAGERARLCDALHRQSVDSLAYVKTVRDHPEATLLMLPHSEQARERFETPNPRESAAPVVEPVVTGPDAGGAGESSDAVSSGGGLRRFWRSLLGGG
jgi:hypothetical protein